MVRVMLILGVLVFVPAAIVFWRLRDRPTVTPPPAPVSHKAIGNSTLSHGVPESGKSFDNPSSRSEGRR